MRAYVRTCVRVCVRVLKIFYVFLDPPTSVLVKYLVIRRKVRPLVYSTHNVGRHIFPTCPPLRFPSFPLSPFADITPLIGYTYANSSRRRRNCNLLLSCCCDTNLLFPLKGKSVFLLISLKRFSSRETYSHGSAPLFACKKKIRQNQAEKNALQMRPKKNEGLSSRVRFCE